jgi:hypothetical protein
VDPIPALRAASSSGRLAVPRVHLGQRCKVVVLLWIIVRTRCIPACDAFSSLCAGIWCYGGEQALRQAGIQHCGIHMTCAERFRVAGCGCGAG